MRLFINFRRALTTDVIQTILVGRQANIYKITLNQYETNTICNTLSHYRTIAGESVLWGLLNQNVYNLLMKHLYTEIFCSYMKIFLKFRGMFH